MLGSILGGAIPASPPGTSTDQAQAVEKVRDVGVIGLTEEEQT